MQVACLPSQATVDQYPNNTTRCLLSLQKDAKYKVLTPRIDSVLDRFRQREPLSSETEAEEQNKGEQPVML